MHHAQIAQRAFDTPLMIAPTKALAFLSGLGPRITGQEIRFDGGTIAEPDLTAARQKARASLIGGSLAQHHGEDADAPFPVIDGVAVIAIAGTLVHRGAWIGQSSGLTSYEGLAAQIDAAASDPAIRGIALEIDSFGGEVAGAFDLADRIRAARDIKPVHAILAEHALSAGYALTRLLRGQRGTEQAIGNPTPAGARAVLMNEALTPLPIPEADLGIPFNWRIGPARHPVSSDTFTALTFTPEGEGLRPFAPVHIDQPWRHPHVPGDLVIRWMRRSRDLAADSWQGMEVPLAEEQESYEVRIMDGAAVTRTLTSTAPSVTYTAAQQIADWGAELAPGDSLTIRICQLSARIGRGTAITTTLYL